MTSWVLIDFETASGADLPKVGAWKYAEDPTTEVLVLCYQFGANAPVQSWRPGEPCRKDLAGCIGDKETIFIAHNAAFEKAIWCKIMVPVFGWPDIPNSRWHDTMAVCAMKALPQDLETVASVLRLPHQKDMDGSRAVRELSNFAKSGYVKDREAKLARTYTYCPQDVRTEVALHERVGALSSRERNVWLLDQRINERGIGVDLDYVSACQEIVDKATGPLAKEFTELTEGLKFTQVAKIREWSDKQGFYLHDLTKERVAGLIGAGVDAADEIVDTEIDNVVGDLSSGSGGDDGRDLPPAVRRALEIRQLVGSAAIKKLHSLEAWRCADGRARGLIQYHGAASGRFAGRGPQPHNFPILTPMIGPPDNRVSMDPEDVVSAIMSRDPAYVELMLGLPPVQGVVSALRHAFIAKSGRTFVAADYSGIEARLLLAISGQADKAAMMAAGQDVYADMASLIFRRPINKKNDPYERDVGKHGVLGLGYRLGAGEFQRRYAADRPLEFSQNVVQVYRKEWAPCVPEFWYALEEAAFKTVWDRTPHETYGFVFALQDEWLTVRLLNGRLLYFYNPQKVRRAMPWDENDVRPGITYQVMKLGQWSTVQAHGGTFTGIMIQATARDLLVDAMFKCEANNMPLAITVHDENVTEPLLRDASVDTLRQIMLDLEPWARQIKVPLSVEVWEGDRYRK